MAQSRSAIFLTTLEDALNNYLRVAPDRPLSILDISLSKTAICASALTLPKIQDLSEPLTVFSDDNIPISLNYEATGRESVQTFSVTSQILDPISDFRDIILQTISTTSIESFNVVVAYRVISTLVGQELSK